MPAVPMKAEANLRAAIFGLVVNLVLVAAKLIAGILGNSYALIADAVESSMDVVGSLVVWTGLKIVARPPDAAYPYGYGRAEPLTVAIVALLLMGAAVGIATAATREIVTPHHTPAPFTLGVLAAVVIVKEVLFRRITKVSKATGSLAVASDAWHHRSDAVTSAAAFLGILIAILGGPGYESADDWAALLAAGVIGFNGWRFLQSAVTSLMDRQPDLHFLEAIVAAARSVPGVLAHEKLRVRGAADEWYVDLHIQARPDLSLHDAHVLSGQVKSAIRSAVPGVRDVLIHMEPWEPAEEVREPRPDWN